MAVQASENQTNYPFILNGPSKVKEAEIVVQDAGRVTGDLLRHTVMSFDPTTGLWHPFTDETAADGTQFPRGISMAAIEEAAIIAGNVPNIPILVGGWCVVDLNQLVIENSLTLATVVNVPAGIFLSVEECLRLVSIYVGDTISIEEFENPAA